ncbi:MAG: bifunctional UDP-sugar hydrolase/5'-nucleotidase [Bacteroidetes bacterium]|nr:bifunctional UDP-sugar hydrolase/5'-nucleotidase [Bacteroidota bacterium]
MKKLLSFLLTAFFLTASNPVFSQQSGAPAIEVLILHLNDMHAKTEGFARIKYLADSLRRNHPHVFIVAAGDNFTGNPYVDMVSDKGFPMIALMNQAGFNLSCFGNHEFDLGQAFLEKRLEQAKFQFICANMNTGSSGLKQPKPYFFLKAGTLQIPVLGLIEINDKGIPDTHPSKVTGITFSDPLKTTGEYVELKKKYGCLIALSHLGIETDEKLAREFPQFDVIIGGHSHTILKKPVIENGVMIVQAGSYQRFIGKLTLIFQGGRIIEKSDTLIALESLNGTDPGMQALVRSFENNPEFEKVAGIANNNISGKQSLGALMTDAVAWAAKADFAFQNKGGIRIQSLPEGEIRVKDIYRLDPFGNQVVIYKMKGSEIGSMIMNSYKKERDIDLVPSGLTYTIKKGKNREAAEVKMLDRSGKAIDKDKSYSVALNSYISAAYTFDHPDTGTTLDLTTEDCLILYLGYKHKVDYKDVERAKLKIPKEKN